MTEPKKTDAPLHKPLLASNAKHGSKSVSDTFLQLKSSPCRNIIFFTEDVGINVIQRSLKKDENGSYIDTNTDYITIPANQACCLSGIETAEELWVKSADDSAITVRYRMEW